MRQDEADDGTRADRLAAAERIAYVAIAHTTPAGAVSDHWPIVMDLTMPASVASSTPQHPIRGSAASAESPSCLIL